MLDARNEARTSPSVGLSRTKKHPLSNTSLPAGPLLSITPWGVVSAKAIPPADWKNSTSRNNEFKDSVSYYPFQDN